MSTTEISVSQERANAQPSHNCQYCGNQGGEYVRDARMGYRWQPCPQCATSGPIIVIAVRREMVGAA